MVFSKLKFQINRFSNRANIKPYQFVFATVALIVAVVFYLHWNQYSNLAPTDLFAGENYQERAILDRTEFNTLLIAYDYNEDFDEHYISFSSLISVDSSTKQVTAITIDPRILIGEFTIQNNLVSVDLENGRMSSLMDGIEDTLALRVDRYIAFDLEDLEELLDIYGLKDDTFEYSDTEYNLIDLVDLNTEFEGEELLEAQSVFTGSFIGKIFTQTNLYRSLWASEKISEIVQSDMNRGELISFARVLVGKDFEGITVGEAVGEIEGNTIRLDSILADEKLKPSIEKFRILAEQAEIEVFNGTTSPGLASSFRRKLDNLGMSVIRTGNYTDIEEENILYLTEGEYDRLSGTIDQIIRLFHGRLDFRLEGYDQNYSGNLVLILGEVEL